MKPTEMVPVFRLSWPDPIVHRHNNLRTETKGTYDNQIEVSRVTDCGRAKIDYVVRTPPEPSKRFGKVTWRSEIGTWMQARHALAMQAHLCRLCWPDEVCFCLRCLSARRLDLPRILGVGSPLVSEPASARRAP